MSSNPSAHVVIGVRLEQAQLYRYERKRGCKHGIIVADAGFCSKCGQPIWQQEKVPVPGYADGNNEMGGLDLVREKDEPPTTFILGMEVGSANQYDGMMRALAWPTPEEKEALYAAVKTTLLKADLPAEDLMATFGTWLLLYESY
jgi:hypothetical protein